MRRLRLFAAREEQPRSRRATDVVEAVAAAVGICLIALVALPESSVERAVVELISTFPAGLDVLWQLLIAALILTAVAVCVAAALRRRLPLLRDVGLALLLAVGVSLLAGRVVQGSWQPLWTTSADEGGTWPLVLAVTLPTAAVRTAVPHLAKPVRFLGRWLIVLAAVAAVLLGAAPSAAIAALLVARISSTAIHLAFGSPQGRPSLADVELAVASLGVRAHSFGEAERQPAGLYVVNAVSTQDDPLVVKIYGRDAYDTQLLTTAWRSIWYREPGSPGAFGRRQQVEREAFLTLLAKQAGLATETVVAAGMTQDDDAVLILKRIGKPLATIPRPWTDDVVRDIWQAVLRLHDSAISHGQLDDSHLVIDGNRIGMINFRGGEPGRMQDTLLADRAQTLVTTALAVGPQRAATGALDALGPSGLAELLPFVQQPTLSSRQRQQVKDADLDLDGLRDEAASVAGIELPELRKLRRVTVGSLVQLGLLIVAFLALSAAFADLDLADLVDQLQSASWVLIVIGFGIAQLPRLAQAAATLGAAPIPLPLGPVYALQLAQSYIGLAVPASAARVALNVRFFQRHGLSPGAALAIGAIDGFAGFVVQAILLLTMLLLTSATLDLDLSSTTPSGLGRLVLILVVLSLVAIVVVLLAPAWRRALFGWIASAARDALEAVRNIRSPRRLGLLFGGNFAAELLFALALGTIAAAFGYWVGLTELLLINMTVSLFAGLLPIPGGIGVVEGGLTLGLVRAGVPQEAAFAIVIMYRLATFYLPPIWGFFALRWLEKNRHL